MRIRKMFFILLCLWLAVSLLTKGDRCSVYGYYTQGEGAMVGSFRSAFLHTSSLEGVCFFWYRLEDGGLIEEQERDEDMMQYLQAKDIETYGVIHNWKDGKFWGEEGKVFGNPVTRDLLIDSIVRVGQQQGFAGINLYLGDLPPQSRKEFSLFVAVLRSALREKGLGLLISVPAKEEDDPSHPLLGAYDYGTLGRYGDRLVLMFRCLEGRDDPGPLAPITWVEQVVQYAVGEVAGEKILLGLPVYGQVWGEDISEAISHSQAGKIAKNNKVRIQWDRASKSPYLFYEEEGKDWWIWFENKRSIGSKRKLVKQYNLGGLALWRLGLEDRDIWDQLR